MKAFPSSLWLTLSEARDVAASNGISQASAEERIISLLSQDAITVTAYGGKIRPDDWIRLRVDWKESALRRANPPAITAKRSFIKTMAMLPVYYHILVNALSLNAALSETEYVKDNTLDAKHLPPNWRNIIRAASALGSAIKGVSRDVREERINSWLEDNGLRKMSKRTIYRALDGQNGQ